MLSLEFSQNFQKCCFFWMAAPETRAELDFSNDFTDLNSS